jgi:hypothetical protein
MDYVRREVEERKLVQAIDPGGIEGFRQCRGRLRLLALFAVFPGYSFDEASQVQGRTMSGSEPKPLITHQSALA